MKRVSFYLLVCLFLIPSILFAWGSGDKIIFTGDDSSITGTTTLSFGSDREGIITPVDLICTDFYAQVDQAPDQDAWTITVRDVPGSDTALTCSMEFSMTQCSSTGKSVYIAKGSNIDVQWTKTGGIISTTGSSMSMICEIV